MAERSHRRFSANKAVQPVYDAMHEAIKDLSRADAIEVLDEAIAHFEAMSEGLTEEMEHDE